MAKKKHRIGLSLNIWILAIMLLVLLLATTSLLGTIIKDYAGGDKNIVAIYPGDYFDKNNGYNSDFVVGDIEPGVEWEKDEKVSLFKNTYTNASGEVTVESAAGDKVIAPGTSNEYDFGIKNVGNISLDYTLTLEGIFTLEGKTLPFYVRLSSGDKWLVGSSDDWASVEELKSIEVDERLESGKTKKYTLEWQWPFESDDELLNDLNDTLIGNEAVNDKVEFSLNINTVTTITEGAQPVDPEGNLLLKEIITRLNVHYIGIPLLLFLIFIPLFILFLFNSRIYVTGFVDKKGIMCKEKIEDIVLENGRFTLGYVLFGRQEIILKNEEKEVLNSGEWYIKRSKDVEGLIFEENEEEITIKVGKGIRAIELYFETKEDKLVINQSKYAAIDKNHRVYTETGIKEPDEEKKNVTPGGLQVNEKGKYSIE